MSAVPAAYSSVSPPANRPPTQTTLAFPEGDPRPKLPPGDKACRIGTAFGNPNLPFYFSLGFLKVHMAVLGESGGGKSKFLELICRFLLWLGEGGFLADPANDLADDLSSFLAYRYSIGDGAMVKRTHFLTVGPKLSFRYDPFASLPPRSSLPPQVYENLLVVKAQRLRRQLMRRVAMADFEVMNRLKKRLEAVLVACGVDYDGRGRHLGLGVADALADPNHQDFRSLLDRVFPYLPPQHQATFRELRGQRPPLDKWESTQNRLAEVLSPLVKLAVSPGPSIDFKKIIANREFVIARMGQTPHWSYDQAVTMLGLLVDGFLEVKEAEEDMPPHLRVPSTLIVDEVGDLIGDDLCLALRNDRKFLLRIILGAQNMTTLVRGDVDMSSYVLSLCQTVISFAQKLRKDKELIEDRLFAGNYSFEKEYQERLIQRGWIPVETVDHSVSVNVGKNWSNGGAEGEVETDGEADAVTQADVETGGESESEAETNGSGFTRGFTSTTGAGANNTLSPIIVAGHIIGTAPSFGSSSQHSDSRQQSDSSTNAKTSGRSTVRGWGKTNGTSKVTNHALSIQNSRNWSQGGSSGMSYTRSFKTTLLANLVSEWEWTGRYLAGSIADQKERNMQILHTLPMAHAILSVYGHPCAIPVTIDFVQEMWASPAGKWAATEFIKKFIAAQHAYNFAPELLLPPLLEEDLPVPDALVGGRIDEDELADEEEDASGKNPFGG